MTLTILDFTVYGNPCDPQSDELLVAAAQKCGVEARTHFPTREDVWMLIPAEHVWLRYDVRSRKDLNLVVSLAERLARGGHRVFPLAQAIRAAEDKWETYGALWRGGVHVPKTTVAGEWPQTEMPFIIKPRVGWGGMGAAVVRTRADLDLRQPMLDSEHICQPFIPHTRTLIAAMTDDGAICCIEDVGTGPEVNGRTGTVPMTLAAAKQAALALEATGLVAGTVDLIETPDGIQVLEVNSSPRLTYPHLPQVDLATPMVEAVLRRWKQP